jgi:hypothetical protein
VYGDNDDEVAVCEIAFVGCPVVGVVADEVLIE